MSPRAGRAGRPGSLDEARELVALAASLSEEGDSLSVDAVAERLGVSHERAEKLVGLVLSSTLVGGAGLPLAEDGECLTLVGAVGAHGRRLRLTRDESLALAAALERLGVPGDDPLRGALEGSLSTPPVDERLVRLLMAGESGTGGLAATLAACGRALAGRRELSFDYRKPDDAEPARRRVAPLGLRGDDGAWLLDAYDLDRGGERTFRVDRMADTRIGASLPHDRPPRAEGSAHMVRLTFGDERYLDLLAWHDLRVTTGPGTVPVEAETPYYGGSWLPRMVAACGGTVRCDDAEVMGRAEAYAREQLSRPCDEKTNEGAPEDGALTRGSRARS